MMMRICRPTAKWTESDDDEIRERFVCAAGNFTIRLSEITGLAVIKVQHLKFFRDIHYKWKPQTASDEDWFLWQIDQAC
ncbi:hypothetical protein BTA30_07360 [Bacillus swezeyi]|uniref:Uncharacterized protein n=1 Tax=Bacillus swezeyi TaxID=1925020 RepID=A0A1R1QTM8_9BACI|nr:hypothetical protein BW143_05340 [Bacillus swezeyi]OMI31422.1 hypothetical protein BTA30_07360 [Bacillus swezeyi]